MAEGDGENPTKAALRLEGEALSLLHKLRTQPFDDAWALLTRTLAEARGHAAPVVTEDRPGGFDALLRQVEEMVREAGNPEGFDAADWLSRWLVTPQSSLGGKRPVDFMGDEEGRATVSRLLAMARDGVYA